MGDKITGETQSLASWSWVDPALEVELSHRDKEQNFYKVDGWTGRWTATDQVTSAAGTELN